MKEIDIRAAFYDSFMINNFFHLEEIAFENVVFTPPAKPWCAIWYLPSQPEVATLGLTGEDRHEGFFQVDLNYPLGSGEHDMLAKWEEIRRVYQAGTRLRYDETEVIIRSCGRTAGRITDGFYRLSINIQFYANIRRNIQ